MLFEKQVEKIYRSNLYIRNDNPSGIFYFSAEDFPGLHAVAYDFKAQAGHDLKGFFYYYDNPIPGRLVVFDHGLGNGHRAYLREVEHLAKAGFLVYTYDHTGCMTSGGESTNGFAQSLSDLDACFTALKQEPALKGRSFSVMGHSWGGFSTMNIAAIHPEITHVISMSGFVSMEKIIEQFVGGILAPYRKTLLALETRTNPDYVNFNAAESLQNVNAKVLLIYSSNDSVISKALHYDTLYKALFGKPNIRFLLVHGKDHSPNYTTDAVAYKTQFFEELQAADKKKQLETESKQLAFMAKYDFRRMTEQDQRVWTIILDYLNS